MRSIETDGLQQELMGELDLDHFLADHEGHFNRETTAEILRQFFSERKISKSALARKSGMSEVYLYQIFSGRRSPSRDRLLSLCFGLEVSLAETQELLKLCGEAPLYPKLRRDAIIMHSMVHGLDLFSANDRLFAEGEKPLF